MRITPDEASAYFAHPSQHGNLPFDDLPGEPFEYWATGGVCGVFHPTFWPGVWMAHYGVKPEVWGRTQEPAKAILAAFHAAREPLLVIGWTDAKNRAALAFCKRLGFQEMGTMPVGDGVVMTRWKP